MKQGFACPHQANPCCFYMHPLYHHVKRFWRHYCGTDVIDSCEVSTSLKEGSAFVSVRGAARRSKHTPLFPHPYWTLLIKN